jgi:hypothetical protein
MKNLIEKCKNERYYQTIKFFYHRLSKDEKSPFIVEVAHANILLASQCLMSDTKNEEIENAIKVIAISDAQYFDDTAKSTAGLLALAEFQLYDTILEIFNSVNKPKRIHILVLNQLFREVDEEVYFKVIETFTNYDKIGLLLATFMSYKGLLSLNTETIQILGNLMSKLIEKNYSGFVRVYLSTYDLWQSTELIFGNRLDETIEILLDGNEKAITLAFYLVDYTNRSNRFPLDKFVTTLGQMKINKKAIGLALEIAQNNSIFNNEKLNQTLTNMIDIGFIHKTNAKKLKFLIRKGLPAYAENVPGMKLAVDNLIATSATMKREFYIERPVDLYLHNREIFTFPLENALSALKTIYGEIDDLERFRKEFSLEEFWRIVFDYIIGSKKKLLVEQIIIECAIIYNTGYKEICSVLRTFTHFGAIKKVETHGYYVSPLTFSSMEPCFLHYSLNNKINHKEMQYNLEIGQTITFNIVGFNSNTNRININLI